jgi:hypothetical protein
LKQKNIWVDLYYQLYPILRCRFECLLASLLPTDNSPQRHGFLICKSPIVILTTVYFHRLCVACWSLAIRQDPYAMAHLDWSIHYCHYRSVDRLIWWTSWRSILWFVPRNLGYSSKRTSLFSIWPEPNRESAETSRCCCRDDLNRRRWRRDRKHNLSD